jgi:hypothetical protein
VQNLFSDLERALTAQTRSGQQYRDLTRAEIVNLFLHKFVYENERFQNLFPWFQQVRLWWAKLTPPRSFVLAEVTATGAQHVRYDLVSGDATEIGQQEADKEVSTGARRFNWFGLFAGVLAVIWLLWTLTGFNFADFSLTWPIVKAFFLGAVAVVAWVYKVKRTKVFVGYRLDEDVCKRLEAIRTAFQSLRKSCKVWMFKLERHQGELDWKYNAGALFRVAKLPAAVFDRPIPNVETNIRVSGLIDGNKAIYFLPEKALVITGGRVEHVEYGDLKVTIDHLEYPESEGHVYRDSRVVGQRWKRINRDGGPDRRFKENVQIPVVRCGIIGLQTGAAEVRMLTSNPETPRIFREQLEAGIRA